MQFDDHGQLTFVRVYRGVLEKGMTVLAARAGRKLRVGRLVQLMADAREEVTRLEAGEIIGFTGCHFGMRTTGDATSVGAATTRTVVVSVFFIILVDAAAATLGAAL